MPLMVLLFFARVLIDEVSVASGVPAAGFSRAGVFCVTCGA